MLGEEDAINLGSHKFNLICMKPGSILMLHKNVKNIVYFKK